MKTLENLASSGRSAAAAPIASRVSMVALLLLPALLAASGRVAAALQPPPPAPLPMGENVVFVGRVQKAADGTAMFDMNGVQVKATVTGTTGLYVSMSQVQKAQGNTFQVFLDGVIQPASRFNTSMWQPGQATKVALFAAGSLSPDTLHTVTIVKDTEPMFAGTKVVTSDRTWACCGRCGSCGCGCIAGSC